MASDFERNIKLFIDATGQEGVDALRQSVENFRAAVKAEQDALKAGGPVTAEALADLNKLSAGLKEAEAAYSTADRVIRGLPEGLREYNQQLKEQAKAQTDAAKAATQAAKEQEAAAAEAAKNTAQAAKEAAQAAADAAKQRQAADEMAAKAAEEARVAEIRARGERARAYADEEAHIQRYIAAADREANAKRWVSKQTADLNNLLEEMAQHEREAATASVQATTATTQLTAAAGRAGDSINRAGNASGQAALKWLYLSNAVQDAQYGFNGIVNNIPGIIAAFGGSAGLAGGVQIAAVALSVLLNNLDKVKELFGSGLAPKLLDDLKDLQKQLADLKGTPPINLIQAGDVERLDKAVQQLERIEAARKAQEAESEQQKKQASIVNAAVPEATGGRAERLDEVIVRDRRNEVSAEVRAIRKEYADRLAAAQAVDERSGESFAVPDFIARNQRSYYDREQAQLAVDAENRRTAAGRLRGAAATDPAARAELARILERNADYAANHGVDAGKLTKALREADDVPKGYDKESAKEAAREDEFYDKVQAENEDRNSKQLAKMDSDYAKKVESDRKKAAAKAKQAQNAANVVQRQAAAKAKAEQDKQIRDVGTPYINEAEAYLAQNELRQRSLPTAANRAQRQQFDRSGAPYALSDADAQAAATRGVAAQLRRNGQDPVLAAPIVAKAVEKLGDDASNGMAASNDAGEAFLGVASAASAKIQQQAMRARQLQMRANQTRNMLGGLGNMGQSYTPF